MSKEKKKKGKEIEIAGKIYLIKELPRIGYLVDIEMHKEEKGEKEHRRKQQRRPPEKAKNGGKGKNRS